MIDKLYDLLMKLDQKVDDRFEKLGIQLSDIHDKLNGQISQTNARVSALERHRSFTMGIVKTVGVLFAFGLSVAGLLTCDLKEPDRVVIHE